MKHPIKNLMNCTINKREGISIIEVLTALVVAAIGVSGVLVLIPFAVRQSQLGIERDLADIVGINAAEELQLRGFTSVDDSGAIPWIGGIVATATSSGESRTTATAPTRSQVSALTPQVVHLDPYAITSNRQQRVEIGLAANNGFPNGANQSSPDILTRYLDNNLKIPVVNLMRRASIGGVLGLTEARLLTQSTDELIFSDTDFRGVLAQDIDGPQPAIELSGAGSPSARQYRGRISWSMVVVPEKATGVFSTASSAPTPTSRYRINTLVYADRNPRSSATGIDPVNGNDMFVSRVLRHEFAPDMSILDISQRRNNIPNPDNLNGGFVPSVNRIVLDPNNHMQADGFELPGAGQVLPGPAQINIFKDDWVMLINRRLPVPFRRIDVDGVAYQFEVEEPGYDLQVAFCRVNSVDQGAVSPAGVRVRNPSLSVEGGPFNFYYEGFQGSGIPTGSADTRITPPLPADYTSETYVVHLKDVINVYERTITLE